MIKIMKLGEVDKSEILARGTAARDVSGTVSAIIADVRANGDAAVYQYNEKFDGAKLSSLAVTKEEIEAARASVSAEFLSVLEQAAANIRKFHEKQKRNGFIINDERGIVTGQKVIPLDKVGLYVPGGTAAYPSTVLMDAIPAKIAGCPELFMVTPPSRNGKVDPGILAAAKVAGIDRVFKVGGAQAIAALAYGTESVPAVYKIVGPGNAYVAEAKRQVFGKVAIDVVAGPSEVLLVSDAGSDARIVAADMLAQAEHDRLSTAVLVTDSMELALAVQTEIERQLRVLPREEIARASIENNGRIIVAEDLDTAIDIANEIAPEHLGLCVDEPFSWLDRVKNAGSIFLGRCAPEALGDYLAGPNHTLPTGGIAKFASPLSVDDFIKKSQFTYYTKDALRGVSEQIALFARKEELEGHARSVLKRFEQ